MGFDARPTFDVEDDGSISDGVTLAVSFVKDENSSSAVYVST